MALFVNTSLLGILSMFFPITTAASLLTNLFWDEKVKVTFIFCSFQAKGYHCDIISWLDLVLCSHIWDTIASSW